MSSNHGADFMFSNIDKKPEKKRNIAPRGIEVTPDEIDTVLADMAKDGKRLAAGLRGAVSALDALKQSGLTGEALVVLVAEKCGRASNGSKLTAATVQVVLEGLFRLGEYVR